MDYSDIIQHSQKCPLCDDWLLAGQETKFWTKYNHFVVHTDCEPELTSAEYSDVEDSDKDVVIMTKEEYQRDLLAKKEVSSNT